MTEAVLTPNQRELAGRLADGLGGAFVWAAVPPGDDYWRGVYMRLRELSKTPATETKAERLAEARKKADEACEKWLKASDEVERLHAEWAKANERVRELLLGP